MLTMPAPFPEGHSKTCQCNVCARAEASFIEWHTKQHGDPPSAAMLVRIRIGDAKAEADRKKSKVEAMRKIREAEHAEAKRRAEVFGARQQRLEEEEAAQRRAEAEKARSEAEQAAKKYEEAAKKRDVEREAKWRKQNPQKVTNLHGLPGGVTGR